jgi:hypothetical protein
VVVSGALLSSGCAAVAVGAAAAGGAGGYAYYKGKITRTYVASFDDVWAATRTALAELGMPIVNEERSARGGTIDSKTASDRVQITFDVQKSAIPAEGTVTQVGVRVATFGDEEVSNRILNQIERHLTLAPAAVPPPLPSPPATAAGPVTLSGPAESAPPPVAPPGK